MPNDVEFIDTEEVRPARRTNQSTRGLTGLLLRLGIVKSEGQAQLLFILTLVVCAIILFFNLSQLFDSPVPDGVILRSEPY